ncbi:MAG: Hpt domain-containing protein [Holophagales bacterium]|nr:Hpt domain-containing protein [Holophagales bacterium]
MEGGFQELLEEFLLEARERADSVEAMFLELTSGDADTRQNAIARAKRELHTLKGNSGMMGFSDLQQIAHRMEDEVEVTQK